MKIYFTIQKWIFFPLFKSEIILTFPKTPKIFHYSKVKLFSTIQKLNFFPLFKNKNNFSNVKFNCGFNIFTVLVKLN